MALEAAARFGLGNEAGCLLELDHSLSRVCRDCRVLKNT